jgi:hypothetical protein
MLTPPGCSFMFKAWVKIVRLQTVKTQIMGLVWSKTAWKSRPPGGLKKWRGAPASESCPLAILNTINKTKKPY